MTIADSVSVFAEGTFEDQVSFVYHRIGMRKSDW